MVNKVVSLKKQSKGKKYDCEDCGKQFSNFNNLAMHFQNIHQHKENQDTVKSSNNLHKDTGDKEHLVRPVSNESAKSSQGSHSNIFEKSTRNPISAKNNLKSEQQQEMKSSREESELSQTYRYLKRKQDSNDTDLNKRAKKNKITSESVKEDDDTADKSLSKSTANDLDDIYSIQNKDSSKVSNTKKNKTKIQAEVHLDKFQKHLPLSNKTLVKTERDLQSNKTTTEIEQKENNTENVFTLEDNSDNVITHENSPVEYIINPNTGQFEKKTVQLKEDSELKEENELKHDNEIKHDSEINHDGDINHDSEINHGSESIEDNKPKDAVAVDVRPFQVKILSPEECIINPLTGKLEMKPMEFSEYIATRNISELPDFSNLNKIIKKSTNDDNLGQNNCLEFIKEGPQRRNERDSDSEDEEMFKIPTVSVKTPDNNFSELRRNLENVRNTLKKSGKLETNDIGNVKNSSFTHEVFGAIPEPLNHQLENVDDDNFQSDKLKSFSKNLNIECEIYQFNHWRNIEQYHEDSNVNSDTENLTYDFDDEDMSDYVDVRRQIILKNPGVCLCNLEMKEEEGMRKSITCNCYDNQRKMATFGLSKHSRDIQNTLSTYSLSLRMVGFNNKNEIVARSIARAILGEIIDNVGIHKESVEIKLEKNKVTCDKCEAVFAQAKNLSNHKKFFHGTNKNTDKLKLLKSVDKIEPNIPLENEYNTQLNDNSVTKAKADRDIIEWKSNITCEQCGQSFVSRNLLHNHKKDKHYSGQFYECGICSAVIVSQEDLKYHIQETHLPKMEVDGQFEPGHNIALRFTKELSLNSDNGNAKLEWKCESINMEHLDLVFKYHSKTNLKFITKPSQKIKLINLCKEETENMGSVLVKNVNAVQINSENNKEKLDISDTMDTDVTIIKCIFKCLECFANFTNENEYTYHKLNIHTIIKYEPTDENGILCEKCKIYFDFENVRDFDLHQEYFHGQLKVQQPANKSKKKGVKLDKTDLVVHKYRAGIMMAEEEEENNKMSNEAFKAFKAVQNYTNKAIENLRNKEHTDHPVNFNSKPKGSTLNEMNPNERNSVSGKSFDNDTNSSQSLLPSHNGTTLLHCDKCDKEFDSISILQQHMKIHYSCNHCGYKCSDQETLQKHIRLVHSGARIPCDQCDYKATGRNALRRHKVIVHKSGPNPSLQSRPNTMNDLPELITKERNTQKVPTFQKKETISLSDDVISNISFSLPENTSQKRKQFPEHASETHLERKKQQLPSESKKNETIIVNDGVEDIDVIDDDYPDVRSNNKQHSNKKSRRRPPPRNNSPIDQAGKSENHSMLLPCKDCGETFQGKESTASVVSWLVQHSKKCSKQLIKNQNTPIKNKNSSIKNINAYIKNPNTSIKKLHACDKCGIEFRFPIALEAHKKQYCVDVSQKDQSNDKKKQFTCHQCSASFGFAIALYEHKDAYHGGDERYGRSFQKKVITIES